VRTKASERTCVFTSLAHVCTALACRRSCVEQAKAGLPCEVSVVRLVSLSCSAKAWHPVIPLPSMKLCCAKIAVVWLLDRPVKPGDDSNGIQALETEH
jgi:hypothetical protein